MALVLLSMFFLGLGSWLLTVTWIETLILTLIHPSLYILTLIHPSLSHISISISIHNISICLFVVAAYPCNPSHPGALTRWKPSCIDQPCGSAKHSRTMSNDCDRSHSVMSRQNNMRKRNWQLYWSSMSLRPFCLTYADALWWDRMHYGETECLKQRCVHQQVSDSSGWLMRTNGRTWQAANVSGWDKHSITIWYNGMALVLLSMFFLGLGSWLLTVTWIETLILTLIHPSLYINTHTSISISYLHFYLNI